MSRASQVHQIPQMMRPQMLPEQRSHSYTSPLGSSYATIKQEPEFSGWKLESYSHTEAAFHPYGSGGVAGTGFVAPAQLWT